MNGPIEIDPAKRKDAQAAYWSDLNANQKQLIDKDGNNKGRNPFDVAPDGSVSFNRWTDGENRGSAQNAFVNIATKDVNGKITGWERTNAWKEVPTFYNDQANYQYDKIAASLKALQGEGFAAMKDLYGDALGRIKA